MTEIDIYAPGVEKVKSLCYFCHANCGVLAYVKDGDVIKIEGDPDYNNKGGLCCRGTSALLHVNHPARVNHALKRVGEKGEGKWEQIPYDQAIQEVADRLNQIKAESGAEAVASAGGTTRTDDFARRRFLNLFGTPNGFHNALLCWIPTFMAETAIAGWSPFETDLGGARCLILWGMNPGASSLPSMNGYTDLQKNGLKIIMVDPRYSETASKADMWLPLRPGSDIALALALLNTIIYEGLYDHEFVNQWCDGFDELREHIKPYTAEWAAPLTWLDAEKIRAAARLYATNTPGCLQWGCTWDQLGRTSTTTSMALQMIRAVCGSLEVPGGDGMPGPALNYLTDEEMELNDYLPEEQKAKQIGSDKFKLTTWPGYQLISDNAKRTWGKTLPAEWFCEAHGPSVFKAILTGDPYQIRALIVCATNPVNSYGDAKMVLAALKKIEFLVTVDYWITPTALLSDYVFPAAGALERPVIVTHYGATDSVMGGRRAIQPKYDRHDDFTFWRMLGLACGQDPELWPWETIEDAYTAIIEPLGMGMNWDEFVELIRMYYPPLHQSKFINNGGFWTPSGKVELNSTILRQLGYEGMPTYIGCCENEIDTPEVAEEYPIVLTTGGGFMPFHHSEHFNMQKIRYLYPDPYFCINPHLAEKLHIEQGDWCWIETRRGRIKMRADVEPIVDPRAVMCPRGWWFPERDGSANLDNPFGCLESNVNTLTSVDDWDCDPMGGSWANRGLLCKVYKCGQLDTEFTAEDAQFSIPGSAKEPGIHMKPSEMQLCREKIPFEVPQPEIEVPEGYVWVWQNNTLYKEIDDPLGKQYYRLDESGWLINPRTKGYHEATYGWRYDANLEGGCLVDDKTGKRYTMEYQEIPYVAGIRCYPGVETAPYEVPEQLTWNVERGCAELAGKPYIYNPESGWLIDPETNEFHEAYYGWRYDAATGNLVDDATGAQYTMSYEPVAAPAAEEAPAEQVPEAADQTAEKEEE